ncbi:MAG: hypothetical protein ACTSRC_10620 [Candidatus Helarchaeota archaeon]
MESIAPNVAHIYIADDTRRAPGTEHFVFQKFINIFEKSHYDGFASVETIMKPSFEEIARQTMVYLKKMGLY